MKPQGYGAKRFSELRRGHPPETLPLLSFTQ